MMCSLWVMLCINKGINTLDKIDSRYCHLSRRKFIILYVYKIKNVFNASDEIITKSSTNLYHPERFINTYIEFEF